MLFVGGVFAPTLQVSGRVGMFWSLDSEMANVCGWLCASNYLEAYLWWWVGVMGFHFISKMVSVYGWLSVGNYLKACLWWCKGVMNFDFCSKMACVWSLFYVS